MSDISVIIPETFPLYGSRLIEASAGTGKTFTLCSLYLRLLLGHGAEGSRHPYPLSVDQILVVTFTEAATEELRSRIRGRIKEARYAFIKGDSSDPFLNQLIIDTPNHNLAKDLLLQAERQMDEASIFTIHGFCQRMLVNSAFESGALFETSFLTDETKLRNQVVADYWRKRFYELPSDISSLITKSWKSPSALLREINPFLSGSPIYIKGKALSGDIVEAHKANLAKIDNIKSEWKKSCNEIEIALSNSDINRRSYTKKSLPKWIDELSSWANEATVDYTIPETICRFSTRTLNEKSKNRPPVHPLFDCIDEFLLDEIDFESSLLKDSIIQCRELLKKAKEKIYVLSFDDLLVQLNNAVKGIQGKILCNRIRELYPIAMIDEFQDTDPLQYNIFSSIYKTNNKSSNDEKNYGIFMIGDPKQAIYAFRGADIFTYIRARKEVDAHYTLPTNWRSTASMVSAVNGLFNYHSSPFIYDNDIQFRDALSPASSAENHWAINGIQQKPMTIWLNTNNLKITNKSEYFNEMALATTQQIKDLLGDKNAVKVKNNVDEKIVAGDIAILVRTSNEAKLIQDKLSESNIASVYLSNRESVFTTTEAHDLLRLMNAMADTYNPRTLKPALATHLLAVEASYLINLEHDEEMLESVTNEFANYAKTWDKKGIMAAIKEVIHNRKIAPRLLSSINGERKVTDLLHIAELLQEESQKTTSKHGLIRWLLEKVTEPDGNSEEQQTRLESDRELVKIITIHKSKGLEYNFVFLPFLASYRESKKNQYHDDLKNRTTFDPKKSQYSISASEKERLAEDLRLLYVAVTRAKYGCFVGICPIPNGLKKTGDTGLHKSAIGWLLQKGLPQKADFLKQICDDFIAFNQYAVCVEPPTLDEKQELKVDKQAYSKHLEANQNCRDLSENWYVTSFSALSRHQHKHKKSPLEFGFEEENEHTQVENEHNIFNFPKGSKAGTFLHTVFESVNYQKPSCEDNLKIIKNLLMIEGYEEHWAPVILKLIDDVLSKKISANNVKLCNTSPEKVLCEMEFMFPINKLNAQKLAEVCKKHDAVSKDMELDFLNVSGMLKGFIDLTFEYEGKFYVLDWKSNYLGDSQEFYTEDALVEAMQDHRYDLQYQIYCLALHKYLSKRLENYSYERHFGGAIYVFLRGVNENNDNGLFFSKPSEDFLNDLNDVIGDK